MITKDITKTLIISAIAATLFTSSVFAGEDCVTQYGGSQYGTACNPNDLVINKEVQKVGASDSNGNPVYVENLSVNDAHITAGNYMTFKLTIKNNSNQTFDTVEVKDIFPPYMSYVSGGPSGTVYDAETRTMTAKLEKVLAGETRTITLAAKVDEEKSFPAGKSNFCVVNTARVSSGNRNDEDTAQVCIKTPDVKGVTTLPKAGFNDIMMILPAALLGLAGLGLVTKKI
jgi:uncharacterized repeat protein (TIGR01451 family)